MNSAPAIHVAGIHQHPLKSCAPISLQRGYIDAYGLAGDRRYLATDLEGKFLTGRKHPRLASVLATPFDGGLVLAAAGRDDLVLHTARFPDAYTEVVVWRQPIQAQRCGEAADTWLSDYLGTPARLMYFGAQSTRPIKDVQTREVSFADGYPLLLTSESSLAWLAERCPSPLVMEQFRPNIVVAGAEAWAEDAWKTLRIGDLVFDIHSPCERCIFTTLSPRTESFHPRQEPLRTLIAHHNDGKKAPLFGQNVIARGTGVIEVGMPVIVEA